MLVLLAALVVAVWLYQLLFNSESALRRVLEARPVRFGMALAMIVYLVIVAQPSTKQFIYFQF